MTSSITTHGGNIEEEARDLKINPKSLLDASASLVPFRPPRKLYRHLFNSLKNNAIRSYPDRSQYLLKRNISSFHNIEPSMVLPGNGAAELFTWAGREASGNGLNGLPSPGFADYERALKCWGANYIHMPLPLTWGSGPQNFPLRPQTNVIWITNPHNPTGQLWCRDSIENLLKDYNLVICDEAFLPLVPNGEKESMIPLVYKYKNLIVIRSLTKLFAIAGLRLGYAISNSKRLEEWNQWRDPWPLNNLAIEAGNMIMRDKSFLNKWCAKVHEWVKVEGKWMYSKLNTINQLKAHPSSINFLLIESNHSLTKMRRDLTKQNILLRDCRSFRNLDDKWLRISLQKRKENKYIIRNLKKFLSI